LNRTVGVDVFIRTDAGTLEKVIPSEIIKIDDNTVHVTWPWPMIGEATVA
jgi:predicted phosphatase